MIKSFTDLKSDNEQESVKHRFWSGNTATSSRSPSALHSWWHTEKAKKDRGLENEIDINEIKAALRGVINRWHGCIKSNPDLFKGFETNSEYNWEQLKAAYETHTR